MRERERGRGEREGESKRHRDRETERERVRQCDGEKDREMERYAIYKIIYVSFFCKLYIKQCIKRSRMNFSQNQN